MMKQGRNLPRTSARERVTQSDGPPIGVHFLHVNPKFVDTIHCLGCESLVDFVGVDVVNLEPTLSERWGNGCSGTDSHLVGPDANHLVTTKAANRVEPELLGLGTLHQKHSGGAIANLTGVASGCGAPIRLENSSQLGEARHGGALAGAIILGHGDLRFVALLVGDRGCHRDDLVLEVAVSLGRQSLGVTLERHLILLCASDAVPFGHILRGYTHGREALPSQIIFHDRSEVEGGRSIVPSAWSHSASLGHALDTSADADINQTGLDRRRNVGDSLQT
mmetsp:Transcript_2270/g.2668  ORF Transcript_2270/g.2668 Transcript_2270/m.2668 type:complete len:278 (-) Transcript_2270:399-1232(-)